MEIVLTIMKLMNVQSPYVLTVYLPNANNVPAKEEDALKAAREAAMLLKEK